MNVSRDSPVRDVTANRSGSRGNENAIVRKLNYYPLARSSEIDFGLIEQLLGQVMRQRDDVNAQRNRPLYPQTVVGHCCHSNVSG